MSSSCAAEYNNNNTDLMTTRAAAFAVSLSCPDDLVKMRQDLGEGPMRFAPTVPERAIEEQIQTLSFQALECYKAMVDRCNDAKHTSQQKISSQLILRYVRNNVRNSRSGDKEPWKKKAKVLCTNSRVRAQLNLTITDTIDQLRTMTLFPVPGLKTKDHGLDVFYMKPARYSPHLTPTSVIIDNLAYCINTMLEKEYACTNGIAFIANMNDWTMLHFSTDYCLQFMKLLQGRRIPVQVQQFLIVNPPVWFNQVWAMMKPMLSKEFQRKVRMIPESKLVKYLEPGYTSFLPNDMVTGQASTNAIVQDFITYRLYVELGTTAISQEQRQQQQPQQYMDYGSHNDSGTCCTTTQVVSDDTVRSSTTTHQGGGEDGTTINAATTLVTTPKSSSSNNNKVRPTTTTKTTKEDSTSTAVKKKKRRFWRPYVLACYKVLENQPSRVDNNDNSK